MATHRPRKRFGQHFLTDKRVLTKLVEAIAPKQDETLVEIGPGKGALTAPLVERVDHMHAVEIDRDLVLSLRKRYPPDRLTVHCADALDFDFAMLGNALRIVGNLPYNISTEVLFRLTAFAPKIRDVCVMLQKEVVDRIVANPSSKDYGRLSVMLQHRFRASRLFLVPADAFSPRPRVESAVVALIPRTDSAEVNDAAFARVVTAAFCQRRKKVANALAAYLGETDLRQLGIDPAARAENLSGGDFARIANLVSPSTTLRTGDR
ncbi:MAG: 16S rRNA (adenine(1518)-N(6)/adenine(1519)-N(6))-dimethyltransferase RsmA [Burkholderiales bacterium]